MEHAIDRMAQSAPTKGVPLFRIGAISFLSLSLGYFPGVTPEASAVSHWSAGLIATLLLFASILLHELAHCCVALRAGIPISEIRLFLFGGVSRMAQERSSPWIELRVAIAGPLMSFALALVCAAFAQATRAMPGMIPTILAYRRRLMVMKDGGLVGLLGTGSIGRFVELRSLVREE